MTDSQSNAIAALSRARTALANAKSVCDVKVVRDQGQAAIKWAKQQHGIGFEALLDAQEIVLLAERRIGEMLAETVRHGGDRKSESKSRDVTLTDHGISKMQSSRWQAEAAVPEEEFEEWVAGCRKAEKLPTSTALVKLGRQQAVQAVQASASAEEAEPITGVVKTLAKLDGKKFACIYADPPWQYGNQSTRAATDNHYSTMCLEDICNEPVLDIVAENAHLHLWTTNAFLFDARLVMEAWGFTYKSCLVWVKPQMGIGNYWRVSHEFMLFGIRGKLPFENRGQKSWVQADRTKHSAKPGVVRGMIEKVSPGPRLEMYGRERREGWVVYGNQISEQSSFV